MDEFFEVQLAILLCIKISNLFLHQANIIKWWVVSFRCNLRIIISSWIIMPRSIPRRSLPVNPGDTSTWTFTGTSFYLKDWECIFYLPPECVTWIWTSPHLFLLNISNELASCWYLLKKLLLMLRKLVYSITLKTASLKNLMHAKSSHFLEVRGLRMAHVNHFCETRWWMFSTSHFMVWYCHKLNCFSLSYVHHCVFVYK